MKTGKQREAVRPETLAMVQRRQAPADFDTDHRLGQAIALARHLWRLLERRYPTEAARLWADMSPDGWEICDQAFEAADLLLLRDQIWVEPVHKLLDAQIGFAGPYVVTYPGGHSRIVEREELLMMAGLPAEQRRA